MQERAQEGDPRLEGGLGMGEDLALNPTGVVDLGEEDASSAQNHRMGE